MSAQAIEIRGLVKQFPGFKLGPLDLTVPMGAIYGFIGPNGAGKTTTIDMIFGMGRLDSGSIQILGLDHSADEVAMKQEVGYVSPDVNYQAWGRVGRVIQFVRGFYPSWDENYCERLMSEFRLGWDEKFSRSRSGRESNLVCFWRFPGVPRFSSSMNPPLDSMPSRSNRSFLNY
jgi:ABC-2 type transport system ATP-binding protein